MRDRKAFVHDPGGDQAGGHLISGHVADRSEPVERRKYAVIKVYLDGCFVHAARMVLRPGRVLPSSVQIAGDPGHLRLTARPSWPDGAWRPARLPATAWGYGR